MLGSQTVEHRAEIVAGLIEVPLRARPRDAAAPAHGDVEVGCEGDLGQPRATLRVKDNAFEVGVVEVAVRETHRYPPGAFHHLQRRRVVLSVEQADLPADQLRMRVGTTS